MRFSVRRALLAAFAIFVAASMALASVPLGGARLAARMGQAARIASLGARAPRAAVRPTREGATHDLSSGERAPAGSDALTGDLAPLDPLLVVRPGAWTRGAVRSSSFDLLPTLPRRAPVARGPPRKA